MLCVKKVYNDELLQLALILSLLRVNLNSYSEPNLLQNVANLDIDNGTSWRAFTPGLLRSHYVHPKSLDSILLNYERDIFADLYSLGRYNRDYVRHSNVTAYLLNIERTTNLAGSSQETLSQDTSSAQDPQVPENDHLVGNAENSTTASDFTMDLTPEDMNLIEILWKQDVDLGFSINGSTDDQDDPKSALGSTPTTSVENGEWENIKGGEKFGEKITIAGEEKKVEVDPWQGLNYTIDTETGEYVIKEEPHDVVLGEGCGSPLSPLPLEDLSLPLEEFLLDEALQLVDLDEEPLRGESDAICTVKEEPKNSTSESQNSAETSNVLFQDSDESLEPLRDMIQTPQFHHPHHRAFHQSRMPFVRTMSMEQRWQDLANLLSFPGPTEAGAIHHSFSHHHSLHNYNHSHPHSMGYGSETTRGVLLHNATLAPPMGDVNGTVPFGNIGGTNLGNAVATSMNLTNSSEPMGEANSAQHYKLEPNHDVMYYQNASTEFNQTDGFLSSILNDEDLQLMDMAMNEGMYTMRMLDTNTTLSSNANICSGLAGGTAMTRSEMERVDTSSDSAVSSMGSERVPSLSDGEWCDAGSDSGHNVGDHYVTDYQTKYRPYDYSYSSRQHALSTPDPARLPLVAQKKHQMFGKRYFQEQGSSSTMGHPPSIPIKYEFRDTTAPTTSFTSISHPEEDVTPKASELKYSCSIEFGRHHPAVVRTPISQIQHNHTYNLPPENSGVMPRPMSRDKAKTKRTEEEHLTRDEKRARVLNIPISVDDIINLPMDEFNERLSKYDLSEAQLSLIRDIRRRGKNKVAAQNCRKRKLDQINTLADEVKEMRDRKTRLINEYEYHTNELKRMKDKYQQLYRHVFQNLRDPDGNQYSPYHYSLQTSADGSIIIVPRSNSRVNPPEKKEHMQDHKNG